MMPRPARTGNLRVSALARTSRGRDGNAPAAVPWIHAMAHPEDAQQDLYFVQAAIGPMQNFAYLIGSRRTRECLIVDPAWDTGALIDAAARDGMRVVGALVTHYHPDHVGGAMGPFAVPSGLADLVAKAPARIHVNKHEADGLKVITGVAESDLVRHEHDDVVELGEVSIQLLHTPGHTPGSQCFLVRDRLIAGDTLFVDGCGRVDLPGGNPADMQATLRHLAELPEHIVLHPGHDYGATPTATLGAQKQTNPYLVRAMRAAARAGR
jgi:glyoxylase-like metal-dependent hydrolase (beta-lactamase superfamily II)